MIKPDRHRILIVDDNRAIHDDFRKILTPRERESGGLAEAEAVLFGPQGSPTPPPAVFEMDSAFQGREALNCVLRAADDSRPYALAFVDVRMPPGWDGIETAAQICRADPDLQIVLCTAYADYSWEEILTQVGASDRLVILKKPFDNIEVSQLAHSLTQKWSLARAARRELGSLEKRVRERTGELETNNRKLQAEIAERRQAETALRKSESLYRELANSLGEGVIFTDADSRFTFANPAAEGIFGVWPGQLLGKNVEDFLDEENRMIFQQQIRTRRAGQKSSYELKIAAANGGHRQLLVTGTPQFNSAGQFGGSFAVLHDITQRKQVEQALRESQRLQKAILDNLPDPAWLKDNQGRYLLGNRSLADLFRRRLEDVVGKTGLELFPASESASVPGNREAVAPGMAIRSEHCLSDGAGRDRWFDTIETPVPNERGEIAGLVGIAHDITERKELELELRQKTALFKAMVYSSPDGILVVDGQGQKVIQNEALTKLVKIPREIAEGSDDAAQLRYVTEHLVKQPEHFLERVQHLYAHQDEIGRDEIEFKDGRILDRISAPILGKSREYYGRIWTFHEITGRKRAESQLRLQTSALEATANGIVITDRTGRILWVNPAFTRLTGYPADEAVGQTTALLKSGKQDRSFYEHMWRTILDGNVWHGELVNRRKDGRCYDEEMTITPVRDECGVIQHFVAVKQDISERKQLERDLAYERDLLQALMDNLPDFIYFKDTHSRFARINFAHARHLGLQNPTKAIGKCDLDFFPVDAARQKLQDEQHLLATGEPILGLIEESEAATGKTWVSSTKVPIRDAEGKITGLVGISRDITSLKHAEDQLQAQEESFRALADNAPDAVTRTDRNLRLVYGNRAFSKDVGLEAAVFLGKTGGELKLPAHDQWQNELKQVIESGKTRSFEFQFPGPDGLNYREARLVPELSVKGEVEFVLAVTRDVTEQRRADNERRMMEVQLRQSQKLEAIGRLAAGIAHEINTPTQYVGDNTRFLQDAFKDMTNVLRSHAAMLVAAQKNAVTPELLKHAEEIQTASDLEYLCEQIPSAISETLDGVERVTKIVRAMKDFSHPGSKEKSPADLNKAVESTATVARNEWKYVADLKLDLAADLPLVPCFLGEFNQSVLNLIVNAAHAVGDVVKTNPGTKGLITISTRRDGEDVEIRVADTGTGIAEIHRPHIFEPFFTTKDVGRGTGQGLALVYHSIVQKHGGTATFETEAGKGTVFILRLPIIPPIPATPQPTVNNTPQPPAA